MKKAILVFLFCFAVIMGNSQCNCTVLFPLSKQYEIARSDTVGNYAVVRMKNEGSTLINSILVKFTDTLPQEYEPIKIPFKVVNHSDTPLVFVQVYWGGEVISAKYNIRKAALKGDTLDAEYKTMPNLNRSGYSSFSKTSTVKTNQCKWVVYFKGIVNSRAKREED